MIGRVRGLGLRADESKSRLGMHTKGFDANDDALVGIDHDLG